MSMVDLPTTLFVPKPPEPTTNTPGFANNTISGANQKRAILLQAPKTGNIARVRIPIGTVTTGTDTDVRLETVDSTGFPSGTLVATNTNATISAASLGTGNLWFTIALTSSAPVNQGDLLAVVIVPTGSPNWALRLSQLPAARGLPTFVSYNGAAWSNGTTNVPLASIEYDDGTSGEIPGLIPVFNWLSSTLTSASTPDELALRFSLPIASRVCGMWAWLTIGLSNVSFDVIFYDSDGTTVLSSATIDGDARQSNSPGPYYFRLPASVSVNANTFYRLAIKPSTSNTMTVYSIQYSSAAQMGQYGGSNIHHSTRKSSGSWTDTTTTRMIAGLMIDGIDIPAGGGGSPASYGFVA